jgi:outer membrane protein assembly factor BamB
MLAANIIFGSHDKNVYCLNYDVAASSVELVWKLQVESQIYATPRIFQTGYLIVCSTTGVICVIDREKGVKMVQYKAEGEIYSTPVVYGSKMYVGCRDNNLYCLKIDIE